MTFVILPKLERICLIWDPVPICIKTLQIGGIKAETTRLERAGAYAHTL